MKHIKNRIFAGITVACILFGTAGLTTSAASSGSAERCESVTDYDLSDETTVVFQKSYSAYNVTVHTLSGAQYAEVKMTVTQPFIYLENGVTLFDKPVMNTTMTLPLTDGSYSWTLPQETLKLKEGLVTHFTTTFYSMVDNKRVEKDPAGSSLTFCGCESLSAPSSYQEFYLSGFSSVPADYADVTVNISRLDSAGGYYNVVSSTKATIQLDASHGTMKLDPAQLRFNEGDVAVLDYTFFKKEAGIVSKVNTGSESVVFGIEPGTRPGDLNKDGKLSKADIVCMADFLSCNEEDRAMQNDGICLRTADLNHDGRISSKDLTILKNVIMGE